MCTIKYDHRHAISLLWCSVPLPTACLFLLWLYTQSIIERFSIRQQLSSTSSLSVKSEGWRASSSDVVDLGWLNFRWVLCKWAQVLWVPCMSCLRRHHFSAFSSSCGSYILSCRGEDLIMMTHLGLSIQFLFFAPWPAMSLCLYCFPLLEVTLTRVEVSPGEWV